MIHLNGDELKDFNSFYDSIENADPTVEVFGGACGLMIDPDSFRMWLSSDYWNLPRWDNVKSDELIDKGTKYPLDEKKLIFRAIS